MAQRTVNTSKYGLTKNICISNNEEDFVNLPPLVLQNICSKLQPNKIIELYNYQQPFFDHVAKFALRSAIQQPNAEPLEIRLGWQHKMFERVVDLLNDKLERITIVGTGKITASDVEKLRQIAEKCPNVSSVWLTHCHTQLISDHDIVASPQSLQIIGLYDASNPLKLRNYPALVEFAASIGNCVPCNDESDVKHKWFVKFFNLNPQLRRIKFTTVRICGRNCVQNVVAFHRHLDEMAARFTRVDGMPRRILFNA